MDFVDDSLAVLTRTPSTLNALLRGLPDEWIMATEGPGTWSPNVVVGHLIHGESRSFEPFDREAQFRDSDGKSLSALLDEFAALRQHSLERLRALSLQPEHLLLRGTHPAFGPVTVRQLLRHGRRTRSVTGRKWGLGASIFLY